ncbi:conjugative transposon protein TraM [Spirosoma telluris]
MTLQAKLIDILGIRKQPEMPLNPPTTESPLTDSPDQRVQKARAIAAKNKMTLLVLLALVLIAGALFGLRTVSLGLRGLRVVPNDPNLYKTVKTRLEKSSIVSSVEAEINNNNLNGQTANPDVNYIARKWNYKPIGQLQSKKLLDTGRQQTTLPIPVQVVRTDAPVATPSKARSVVQKHQLKRQRSRDVAGEGDPFNTVRVTLTESVTASTPRPSASPSVVSSSNDVDGIRYIPAAVYGKQLIRTGGKVRFRTTEAVTFLCVYIPRNTILTAVAYLGSGRIQFQVPARMIAGQKLPVDLMCVDTDYQTGITYNYDYVNDNMRQVGGTTVNDAVSSATTYIPYGSALGVVGSIGSSAARGIANAVTAGSRQRSIQQVEIQDGYQVFFKSTK